MTKIAAEVKAAAVARLEELRADGVLTAAHVRTVARSTGVSERTVWRWLSPPAARPARQPRAHYVLSETDREAFAFYRGNTAALHRARQAVLAGDGTTAGAPVPEFLAEGWAGARPVTLRTLQRAFAAELTPAERAAWRTGESGRRAAAVYLRRPDAPRGRIWEMDHKQLPLLVLPPKGAALAPWITTVVDDGTRALLGWAIAISPTSATVFTAMRMAMVHDPAVSPFGAVPERVRIDRGLEFAADAVEAALGTLAVVMHRLPAFQPHRKGKVERLNLTIEQMLISQLPGFTGGPRDASGTLYGPVKDSVAAKRAAETDQDGPLRIERFVRRFADWAHWYNTERPHRMLGGRTPLQAWNEDTTPVRRIPADQLHHLMLASAERTIQKDGINFRSLSYVAPELHGRVGQSVEVRYMPHDDRTIEVFLGGKHLCTAHPTGQLSPEQTEAFRAHARAEAERLGKERRRASRRSRRELAPMTGDGAPAQESRLVAEKTGAATSQRARDAALRARSSTSLLGITPLTKKKES
ncbi:DDE-type integrase/transposase/recombinase [Streptomyces sp. SID8111]|uniref:Mu transposase C-terminal domain-containing protein n=1 Tax=Streptomyces sp. SID8111 TaxID=2706100 RepID=UPI0013BF68DB|nr:DDE-type integrase/transposase/recombinase [Streptomyces diastaticus]NEC28550.1 DDE-type integrase/transposase/recombinase [Streptomyces sp. SID8111]